MSFNGALTINALSAADYVIVTANPQLLAMKGLQDFLKTVSKIKNRLNDKLQVAGILLTMCEGRTNLCKTITEEVQDTFKGKLKVFWSMVPSTVKVGESGDKYKYFGIDVDQEAVADDISGKTLILNDSILPKNVKIQKQLDLRASSSEICEERRQRSRGV